MDSIVQKASINGSQYTSVYTGVNQNDNSFEPALYCYLAHYASVNKGGSNGSKRSLCDWSKTTARVESHVTTVDLYRSKPYFNGS